MSKSIFISYVYEDKAARDQIEKWAKAGKLGPNMVAVAESKDLRNDGEAAIKNHLNPKIRGAAAVVCLVGENTHSHGWVQHELSVAASLGKKVILVRIPGTTGAAPPHNKHQPLETLDPLTLRTKL